MILVGVDFDDGSRAALAHARALALATGMRWTALHVREYGEGERWQPGPEHLAWADEAGLLQEDLATRLGVAWVELVRYAKEARARIIVVGRHGRIDSQPLSLGPTALRLATNANHPVLLVSRPQAELTRQGLPASEPTYPSSTELINYGPTPSGEAG